MCSAPDTMSNWSHTSKSLLPHLLHTSQSSPSRGLQNRAQAGDWFVSSCFLFSTFTYSSLPGCCCYPLCRCCHLSNGQSIRWKIGYHNRGTAVLPLAIDLDRCCSLLPRSPLMIQLTNTPSWRWGPSNGSWFWGLAEKACIVVPVVFGW